MNNAEWLSVFKEIGARMRKELPSIIGMEGGLVPLGRGAGGDKTFPVDRWAEDIILQALERAHKAGESFTLVSEELGIKKFGDGEKVVLVDPIDGSNNAKSGIPFFSSSIALLDGDRLSELAAGYVINLAMGDEFWAVRGGGTFKNGKPARTSAAETVTIVAYEASAPGVDIPRLMPLIRQAKRTRCFGSVALDLSYVASGALSLLVIANPARSFDYAAGMLILKEAGGVITDFDGKAIDSVTVGLERTVPLIASANERLHATALAALAPQQK